MKIEEVKDYFKNAKAVICLNDNKIYNLNKKLIDSTHEDLNSFWMSFNDITIEVWCNGYFAEIVDPVYTISEETILKYQMEDEFPELFEPKIEVGKWYKGHENLLVYVTDFKDLGNINGYGFNTDGDWEDSRKEYEWGLTYKCSLATKEEVEEALTAEAKKRGYKDGGYVKSLIDGNEVMCKGNSFRYYTNNLWLGCCIFRYGKWA